MTPKSIMAKLKCTIVAEQLSVALYQKISYLVIYLDGLLIEAALGKGVARIIVSDFWPLGPCPLSWAIRGPFVASLTLSSDQAA